MGCTQAERCAGLCGCGLKAVRCLTGFLSRSFENNWNIYKLLAHQKLSKEKVRGWALQGHSHCHPALVAWPSQPAALLGSACCPPLG